MDNILETIAGTLEPIAEQDWHGKWRIKKAIELCRNKHIDHIPQEGKMVSTQNPETARTNLVNEVKLLNEKHAINAALRARANQTKTP